MKLAITKSVFTNWYLNTGSDQDQEETRKTLGESVAASLLGGETFVFSIQDLFDQCEKSTIPLCLFRGFENTEDKFLELDETYMESEVILINDGETYIVYETWNGEGYSEENKACLMNFVNEDKAKEYIREMVNEATSVIGFEKDEQFSTDSHLIYTDDEDAGAYGYIKFEDWMYGVEIACNVNEVRVLSKEDFELNLAGSIEFSEEDIEDGDLFVAAEDMDYQFVILDFNPE